MVEEHPNLDPRELNNGDHAESESLRVESQGPVRSGRACHDEHGLPPSADRAMQRPVHTRREFLGGAVKKALYVTPVVLTLTAASSRASSTDGFDSTCGDFGSPCTLDAQCCSLMCVSNDMRCSNE
jgi:hypothetical protein